MYINTYATMVVQEDAFHIHVHKPRKFILNKNNTIKNYNIHDDDDDDDHEINPYLPFCSHS